MPFLLTRTNLEDIKADIKVIGACPYRTGIRTMEWQPDLWAEQRRIQQMNVGESMLTSGKEFDAKYGIISVPPIWEGGGRKEALHLAACYDSALRLAYRRRCKSIAFALLSGDCNGFPRDLAVKVAVNTIREFLTRHEMMIYLSVKDSWAQHLPKPEIPGLQNEKPEKSPQQLFLEAIQKKKENGECPAPMAAVQTAEAKPRSFLKTHQVPRHLDYLIQEAGETFSQMLLRLISEKGLTDPQVYQKANVDRRLFSKIRSNAGYQPSKQTAIAFALALELDLEETKNLIGRAGFAFSDSNKFDIILQYYIGRKNYDFYEINQALFVYDQPLIGA